MSDSPHKFFPLTAFLRTVKECEDKCGYDSRNYEDRNAFILHALSAANDLGLPCGLWHDPKDPNFPVVWIELPTGQVSWHIPFDENRWDGHGTEEKYQRVEKFLSDYKDEWV